jgi:hypothetical protein
MDLSMPELNGADAARAILERDARCRVIVLSMYAQREYVRRALKAGAGLFVRQIREDKNTGQDGWVYKVGRKAATSGAADPSGPFGTGRRLRSGQRVTWFYCRLVGSSCQRTLALKTKVEPGAVTVKVTGYDDAGDGNVIPGATVISGAVRATSGVDGRVRLLLPAGKHRLRVEKAGLVRSFTEKVTIP